jgi:hypothetical protein
MSRTVTTINPATGEALKTYDATGRDEVLDILDAVYTAQPGWAAVPTDQRADHLRAIGAQLRKFGLKQRPVAGELAHRLRLVAFGQVHLDEGGMGAFPKWLRPDGCTGGLSGFTPAASGDEASSECFQGMQPKLAPVFSLKQDPVVVPVGRQVARQGSDGGRAQLGPTRCYCRVEQPTSERLCVADVNSDALGKVKLR